MRRWTVAVVALLAVCGLSFLLLNRKLVPPVHRAQEVLTPPPEVYREIAHSFSPSQRPQLLNQDFALEKSIESLPDSLKTAFNKTVGESEFDMANPRDEYQITDFIEPGLKRRRLIFAGKSTDEWFLYYEKGGRGKAYFLVVFSTDKTEKPQFRWAGVSLTQSIDIQALRADLASGRFSTTDYW